MTMASQKLHCNDATAAPDSSPSSPSNVSTPPPSTTAARNLNVSEIWRPRVMNLDDNINVLPPAIQEAQNAVAAIIANQTVFCLFIIRNVPYYFGQDSGQALH